MAKNKPQIPGDLAEMLSAADKARGFPAGTMASVLQQEVGGQMDKFLADPSAYHYEKGADGRRVAGHTGKVSTAFGPFGILESTGADPGYGVQPLKDKSLGEQVRFAADYLQARSKGAGSLAGGLAGYGEGEKYAAQVSGRIGKGSGGGGTPAPTAAAGQPFRSGSETARAAVPADLPEIPMEDALPVIPEAELRAAMAKPAASISPAEDAWQKFLSAMPRTVRPADLNFGARKADVVAEAAPVAARMPSAVPTSLTPNFRAFGQWGARI